MVPEIDVDELEQQQRDGAVILDVREDDEWLLGHLAGALHIPLATIPDRFDELPSGQPVYVICALGGRSAQAVQFLRAESIEAVNVEGGITAWIDAGKPIEAGQ